MIMPICIVYACYLKQSSLNLVQSFIINMSILVPSTITATIASIINSDAKIRNMDNSLFGLIIHCQY